MKNTQNKYRPVYGVIGMLALFLIGGVAGYIINGSDRVNHSIMTEKQCAKLADKMEWAIRDNRYDEIETLNKVYSENCLNRNFKTVQEEEQKEEAKKVPDTTCGQIEVLLLDRLSAPESQSSYEHVENAKIYANLSERGCAENSAKYKNLAKKELEIARALDDDKMYDREESVQIVETYKRIQMQAEAEKMIEKAKKLTNPAIDFIIQLEKIIEE